MKAYDPVVRQVAKRMFASPFEQDEAMQEIWLHIFRRRESLDVNRLDAFSGWVATLARNQCVDYARKIGRFRPEIPSDESVEHLPVSSPLYDPVEAAQLRNAVTSFKAKLKNDHWRRFFELHFEKGLSVQEAATLLEVSSSRGSYLKAAIIKQARRSTSLRRALGLETDRRAAS